jgi:hypothetical protein
MIGPCSYDVFDNGKSRLMVESDFHHVFSRLEERLVGLGEWVKESVRGRKAALLEVAGRDSIAAAVLAGDVDILLPTVVYTGTEYGAPQVLLENIAVLGERLEGETKVLPALALGSPSWWAAVNGRFFSLLQRLYGNSFTCVGCHMYLHAARIPLAREMGISTIISGERESHNGRVKINQSPLALDAYSHVTERFGIELRLPLRRVSSGGEVSGLVGDWEEGGNQRECVLSRNYLDLDGKPIEPLAPAGLQRYLNEYLLPVTYAIVESLTAMGRADYLSIVEDIFRGIVRGENV